MAYCFLLTKLFYRKARLIRFPFDIRGRKYIDLGENLTTGRGCRLEAFSSSGEVTMQIGCNVQMNDYVHICSMQAVVIGNNVLLAGKIYISDNAHGYYDASILASSPDLAPLERPYNISSVIIEDNVWIGENVVILPGTHIGRGVIIGANSVVKGKVPANSIIVGAPARIVKRYNFSQKAWLRTNSYGEFLN